MAHAQCLGGLAAEVKAEAAGVDTAAAQGILD